MIIEKMSPEAIYQEMSRDMELLMPYLASLVGRELRKKFARSKVYPAYAIRKWKSPVTQTKWEVILVCPDKKDANTPDLFPYVKCDTDHGKTVFLYRHVSCLGFIVLQYTPHFFSRYRERYIEPLEVNTSKFEDVIQYYFYHNQEIALRICCYDYCYGSCDHGSIFGSHVWDRFCLIKTYINNGMLSDSQRRRLDEFIKKIEKPSESFFYHELTAKKKLPERWLKNWKRGLI